MDDTANPEKPAKRQHCVGYLTGSLVEHDVVNLTKLFAFGVEDRRARDLGG